MTTEMDKDLESLKADLNKFKEDLSVIMSDVGNYSHDKVNDTRERLGIAMSDFKIGARERAGQAGQFAHQKTSEAIESSKHAISRKPFAVVAASFAAGIVTGILFGRHNHEQH